MSTDVPAVCIGVAIRAHAIIVSKHGVDGVYEADPQDTPTAKRLPSLTATRALDENLAVMDAQAILYARKARLPIHVVGASDPTNLSLAVRGEVLGSRIDPA